MTATLNRTFIEKAGSILMVLLVVIVLWWQFNEISLIGKVGILICCIAASVNFVFIIATPAAKIVNSELFLYASAQPIFFNLRPQVIHINRVTGLEISKNFIESRAIFSFQHGAKYYYSLPRTSAKLGDNFLQFLANNTDSEIIKAAYRKNNTHHEKTGQ